MSFKRVKNRPVKSPDGSLGFFGLAKDDAENGEDKIVRHEYSVRRCMRIYPFSEIDSADRLIAVII